MQDLVDTRERGSTRPVATQHPDQLCEIETLIIAEPGGVVDRSQSHDVGESEGTNVGLEEKTAPRGQRARLEEHDQPPAGIALAQAAQSRMNLGRMMGKVVDHESTAAFTHDLQPSLDSTEGT